MRNIWTIAKREFNHYFVSPVAYAVAFALLLILGGIYAINFTQTLVSGGAPQVEQWVFGPFVTLAIFLVPGVTMRLLAEEQRSGTMELLMTAPLREWELVIGKWLAAMAFMAVMLLLTLVYFIITNAFTTPGLDWGVAFAAYVGFILLLGALLAVGLFISSLFTNQIAAFFSTAAIILILWIIGLFVQNQTGLLADVINYIDLSGHFYDNFVDGKIDLSDVTYFISAIVLFLFLAARVVESRRWR